MTQTPSQGYGYDSAAPQAPAQQQPAQSVPQPVQPQPAQSAPVESVSAPLAPANVAPQNEMPQPAPAYTEQPSAPLTAEQPTGSFVPNPYALQGVPQGTASKQKTPPATAHYIMAGLIGLAIVLVYIVPILPIASGGLFGVDISMNWFTDTSALDESNPYTPMAMVVYFFNTVLLLFVILFVALRNSAMRITAGIIAIVWGVCHLGFALLILAAIQAEKSSSGYGALMTIGPSFPVLALAGLLMLVAGILILIKFGSKSQSTLPIQPAQPAYPAQQAQSAPVESVSAPLVPQPAQQAQPGEHSQQPVQPHTENNPQA